MHTLSPRPLTALAFAPFGDVISVQSAAEEYLINGGSTQRFHDISRADIADGVAGISIFRALVAATPDTAITHLERHPLGSQAIIPLGQASFLVVVGAADDPERLAAFVTDGHQGVSFHRNSWHHAHLALRVGSDFLVVDRVGVGSNRDLYELARPARIDWTQVYAAT